jgi:hypothetical protein
LIIRDRNKTTHKPQFLNSSLILESTMGLLTSASSTLTTIFASSQAQTQASPSTSSFPQFSKLPIELRLKIWAFALEPRPLRVHLHKFDPSWLNDQQRYESYAPDWPEHSSLAEPFDGPQFTPMTEEEGREIYCNPDYPSDPQPYHMVVTPCTDAHPCRCTYYPPSSTHALPLPPLLSTCRESREAFMGQYIRCLESEYSTRGVPVVHPTSLLVKSPPSTLLPQTGLIINPFLDTIILHVNVAYRSDVQQVHYFASILSTQLPEVRKVVIQIDIAMPPYKFWQSARFQYWRRWGEDGWWVPTRFLIRLRGLREVVLVCGEKEKMLPSEWRARTEGQWVEELEKKREEWLGEWRGEMLSLRFVGDVKEA